MAYLILVRHGLTDWNKEGRWHGQTDIPLNEEGKKQAREAAKTIKDIKIDIAYISNLSRNKQTYQEISDVLNLNCPVFADVALNERNYGIYTGKNKWQVQKEVGEKKFLEIRRSWDSPIPKGESLKDVSDRLIPFYRQKILKDLKRKRNVLVVSSGNPLRGLIKYLENISNEEIVSFELGFGDVYVYEFNEKGKIVDKKVRAKDLYKGKH